ncbi:MAG: hypothetical protein EAZ06_03100 [Cytophagales bacterium]|nr:MAG: hypothetical protein EAZ06_03100 [Cytophagales bacterium]
MQKKIRNITFFFIFLQVVSYSYYKYVIVHK